MSALYRMKTKNLHLSMERLNEDYEYRKQKLRGKEV